MNGVKGYIYILTNPSFKEYVKIGYADDINERLKQLNRSECIPFAFRVYATYEVDSRLSDMKIHSIIDRLNPNLRSIETFQGKERKREFYAMSPEDAYGILEAIAEINGRQDKLRKIRPTKNEEDDEKESEEIEEEQKTRRGPFRFSYCGIKPEEIVTFYREGNPYNGVACTVVDDMHVEYLGKVWALSPLATKLLDSKWSVQGPDFFRYKGEKLTHLRIRLEEEKEENNSEETEGNDEAR